MTGHGNLIFWAEEKIQLPQPFQIARTGDSLNEIADLDAERLGDLDECRKFGLVGPRLHL